MDEARADLKNQRRGRSLFVASLVIAGISAIALGAAFLFWPPRQMQDTAAGSQSSFRGEGVIPAADQTVAESDRAAIAVLIQRETGDPIRSLTGLSDDSVEAFVGADEYLGGQIFTLRRFEGQWRVEHLTLLF